jgi:hypothetical protein
MSRTDSGPPSRLRAPNPPRTLPAFRVYLTALALFAATIGGLEVCWRSRGFMPDVPDSSELWAYHRRQVVGDDPNLLVAIGTSRIRTDLRSDESRRSLPSHRLIQLGINGPTKPLGLLDEISRIPRFCGVVLCDLLPPLMDPEPAPDRLSTTAAAVAKISSINTYLHDLLCERFVVLNPVLTLRRCVTAPGAVRPKSDSARQRVHADRGLDVTYVSAEAIQATIEAKLQTYEELYAHARHYKNMEEFKRVIASVANSVARIQHNGGEVVFLRLPAAGARLKLEESAFPSAVYFEALARVTGAPWIDFRDLSEHGKFDCPDESHLSPQGARAFTARLIERLQAQSLLGQ